jgi:hypothetical protein
MTTVLWLLAIQGAIGAFDTLYYHELRARLPGRGPAAHAELRIHAMRDFFYAVLFGGLPWIAWSGDWVIALCAVLLAEIVLTMIDFVVEIRVRKPLGDVFAGERITHAVMAIVYGGMLASLLPIMWQWWSLPTELVPSRDETPMTLRWCLTIMAVGVFLSGLRDLYATLGLPGGGWPWANKLSDRVGSSV